METNENKKNKLLQSVLFPNIGLSFPIFTRGRRKMLGISWNMIYLKVFLVQSAEPKMYDGRYTATNW